MHILILFVSLIFLSACSQESETTIIDLTNTIENVQDTTLAKKENTYYIGFDLRGEPQEDLAQYLSLLDYLHKETGLNFKLSITPKESSPQEELCSGQTDFSFLGALSFIKAHDKCDAQTFVSGLNAQDLATYKSMFIVKKASKIDSIKDLKGVDLAFGAKNSTQGYLIPQKSLMDNNISLQEFKSHTFTSSHQECAESVLSGDYDVCSLQDTLAKKLENEGLVKIIYASPSYPSSLIATRKDIPHEDLLKIKKALLNLAPLDKDETTLYHWQRTEMPHGFIESSFEDYSLLYDLAIELGIVNSCEKDLR